MVSNPHQGVPGGHGGEDEGQADGQNHDQDQGEALDGAGAGIVLACEEDQEGGQGGLRDLPGHADHDRGDTQAGDAQRLAEASGSRRQLGPEPLAPARGQ
jgi:hypothetical protein